MAPPVIVPLASSLDLFIDEVVFAATTDVARGSKSALNARPAVNSAWLEAIPDLRESKGMHVEIDGVQPYNARILAVL